MAMNPSDAATAVLAVITAQLGPPPAGVNAAPIIAQRQALAQAIAALIPYIIANATITTPTGPGQIS